jgi:death-on-curing protein
MRYLTVGEILELYSRVMNQSGGSVGILDLGALESAVAQPRMTFNGEELYPTIVEKASALGFSLIQTIRSSTETSVQVMQRWKHS